MDKKRGQAGTVGTKSTIIAELEQEAGNPGFGPKASHQPIHISRNNWNSIWGSALGHMLEETHRSFKKTRLSHMLYQNTSSEQQADGVTWKSEFLASMHTGFSLS